MSSKIFLVQLEEDLLTLLVVPHQLLEVEDEVGEVQEDGIAEGSQLSEASKELSTKNLFSFVRLSNKFISCL